MTFAQVNTYMIAVIAGAQDYQGDYGPPSEKVATVAAWKLWDKDGLRMNNVAADAYTVASKCLTA